jgi:branched-chain amino acid transport system permease protein
LGFGFLPSLIASMVVCGILGVLIERIAYKPLRKAPRITALITAIGVSYVIEYTTQLVMGPSAKTYPTLLPNLSWNIGPVRITFMQLIIFSVTIILMIALQFIVKKTKIGRAMRAVSTDETAAKLMGINVDATISFTFLIGSMLAGAGGCLVGIYYNSITPLMGMVPGVKAFVAAVVGGIGSIPGAMIGGLFIGICETMVVGYGSSLYRDAIVYAILIIVLIVKPSGLLGKNQREKV